MYCAIIGDMIDSRSNRDRNWLQNHLSGILVELNRRYAYDLASLFTITIGDEFQGLLKNTENLFAIIDYIKFVMYPQKIRFGIGFGDVETAIDNNKALGADGPAYHNARDAMDILKSTESMYEQPVRDVLLVWDNKPSGNMVDIINAALSTCALIESNWTYKQREVVDLLQQGGVTQSNMAEKLKIEQTSVHRRLKAADYYTYKYVKEAVTKAANEVWEAMTDE